MPDFDLIYCVLSYVRYHSGCKNSKMVLRYLMGVPRVAIRTDEFAVDRGSHR